MYSPENRYTIAFYNLENFFDAKDDPHSLDDDFTPGGLRNWNESKFRNKSRKIARALSEIGREESNKPPVLVGIAEVENKTVITSILQQKELRETDYDFVHFDSPDERGIDTALIYQQKHFKVLDAETLPLLVDNVNGARDFTRDILYVHGKLNQEEVHVFVNHWPSRGEGAEVTSYKRVKAAETILAKVESLEEDNPNCIIMGDFNDDPNAESIHTLMGTGRFINPMKKLLSPVSGSANYKRIWSLFDQILLSHTFLDRRPNTHGFVKAAIFSPRFLKEWKGRYKGNPFRTFVGETYLGGYSDHFPVYVVLEEAHD
ncbi:Endonuclease/Exonuclease/phosphatase family protein [Flagellimonas taeanensis]|uniref:Endonuclease/Exonuclease/phosphatase family protein n=1 Tax=Flagellimonas taeanensis TaxID=1005926 RepID=A0A1M6QLY6_9FLAO|nr:endonuclease [Allomuricauda taeanensis]SFB71526.1 Endonuclease/Exonuclease/phosphatase family protein [Allomuricauda taeanensis]SHK21083.1 Endonuclease/Exonuclease/phosphatase family protein [Allomuricauda taeanensis]